MLQSFESYTVGSILLILLREVLQSFGAAVGWVFLTSLRGSQCRKAAPPFLSRPSL
jgi:hypothetical protein